MSSFFFLFSLTTWWMMVDDLYFPVKFGRRKLFVVEDPSDYFPVCVFNCGGEILPKQFLMISQTWRLKRRGTRG